MPKEEDPFSFGALKWDDAHASEEDDAPKDAGRIISVRIWARVRIHAGVQIHAGVRIIGVRISAGVRI